MTIPTTPSGGIHGDERWPAGGPATLDVALPTGTVTAHKATLNNLVVQRLSHTVVLFARELPGTDDVYIDHITGLIGYAWLTTAGNHIPPEVRVGGNAIYVGDRTITVSTEIGRIPPRATGRARSHAQIAVAFFTQFSYLYESGTPLRKDGTHAIPALPDADRIPIVALYTIEQSSLAP